MADATGTTVWRWDQAEPFGNNPADEDPDSNSVAFDLPLRLPGQRYDQETGLHYNYFRDYDPSLGRYGESDPIGLRGGLNTYSYSKVSPVQWVDFFGLLSVGPSCDAKARGIVETAEKKITEVLDKCMDCPDRERVKEKLKTGVVNCTEKNVVPFYPGVRICGTTT